MQYGILEQHIPPLLAFMPQGSLTRLTQPFRTDGDRLLASWHQSKVRDYLGHSQNQNHLGWKGPLRS